MCRYLILLLILIINADCVFCEDTKFIFHEKCINVLYRPAVVYFNNSGIDVYRDSRGIILRFGLNNIKAEYEKLSDDTLNKLIKVQYFLAKIKNPAIIEVHVSDILYKDLGDLKKWEISAVIAGNIGQFMKSNKNLANREIFTIGYGEFLPANNTSNNGGKKLNRIDIIILCNVNGE